MIRPVTGPKGWGIWMGCRKSLDAIWETAEYGSNRAKSWKKYR